MCERKAATKDVKQKSPEKTAKTEEPCIRDIKVKFNAVASPLLKVWDLWIDERPTDTIAKFDVTTDPPHHGGVTYEAEILGDKGTIKRNLPVTPPDASATLCSVSWDGTNDKSEKVDVGKYKVKLIAKGGDKTASDTSTEIKILRVGIVYVRFKNVYPLKYAFQNYPATFVKDDFAVPREEWKIASLDDGLVPRTPPVCQITGKGPDPQTYCYPFAAKRKTQLKFRVGTAGKNYASGDGIKIKVVCSGTETAWSNDTASGIDVNKEYWFEANNANKLPESVQKIDDLHFDFLFGYIDSQGKPVKLGRQTCSKWVVYIIVSQPTEPWGFGYANHQKVWVELLEKVCTDWAKGAQTVEQAAGKIVTAVNSKMTLRYDIVNGEDIYGLTARSVPLYAPDKIKLRNFLGWLENAPGRPTKWNVVNCTCCGALVSTIANSVGCSLNSSRFGYDFDCHKVISIGYVDWKAPFSSPPAYSAGGFTYHEVAWTGSSSATDNIYDACLKVAADPVSAPATNPLSVKGMVYKSSGLAIDDYVRRLVVPLHVSRAIARQDKSGRYKAV